MKRNATTILVKNPTYSKKPRLQRSKSFVNPPPTKRTTVEKKNYDYVQTLAPSTGAAQPWSDPASIFNPIQGAGSSNRIGRKTTATKLVLRYRLWTIGALGTTDPSQYRIKIVYDKQANKTLPSATDIVLNPLTVGPLAMNNLFLGDRFITIMDELTPSPQMDTDYHCGQFIRKINLVTTFSDQNTGSISDINTGAFIIMVCSSNVGGSDRLQISLRFRYLDD
jgi:hypothetical protein